MPDSDPNKIIGEFKTSIEDFKASQSALHEQFRNDIKDNGEISAKALAAAEQTAKDIAGASARILEIEQEMQDAVAKGKAPVKSLGQMVIESDQFKEFAQGNTSTKMTFKANTIIGQEGSPPENSDTLVAPQRLQGIIPGASRLLRIADVIPQGTTTSNAVEYTRESSFTNNAAETAEAGSKPESALGFELVTANVRTIAHFIKTSVQVIEDAPALQSYIDVRMRYGVDYRVDSQILNGNGTGQNISGMMDTGNHTAFTAVSGENQLDSINRAIYAVYAADYAPTAIIMNPADWGKIERLKVGTADDRYVVGNPTGMVGPMLWGLPVIISNAMTSGKFLVASFDIAYMLWNRQETVVEMFAQDEDNVQTNLLTIRAEARKALATYRPASAQGGNLLAA
jgi:HK97 family phage major capsid protein